MPTTDLVLFVVMSGKLPKHWGMNFITGHFDVENVAWFRLLEWRSTDDLQKLGNGDRVQEDNILGV